MILSIDFGEKFRVYYECIVNLIVIINYNLFYKQNEVLFSEIQTEYR